MASLGSVVSSISSSVTSNQNKIAMVSEALDFFKSKEGTFLGLFDEGGGRRNEMRISNGMSRAADLDGWYLEWGYCKVPPEGFLNSMRRDESLFHNAGSWACTGSSGVVTYKLDYQTNLHIMWECPYNFDLHDNYIGLMLTSEKHLKKPNKHVFKGMFSDGEGFGMAPSYGSMYDLVCCGPGKGNSREEGGSRPCGSKRACLVQDHNYAVYATMGDRHATVSKITIIEKSRWNLP